MRISLALLLLAGTATAQAEAQAYWPQWRGPLFTGEAPQAKPPIEWSEKKNIRWKVEVPGLGHSTPVIWGDRVFVTSALPFGEELDPVPDDAPGAHNNAPLTRKQRFLAFALSRKDGSILWQSTLRESLPHAGGHTTSSFASASPMTDGESLFAFFGSDGLYALDAKSGEVIWEKDLGNMRVKHGHGEGASPVIHDDRIVVTWDHEAESFVVALNKKTGEEIWRKQRDEVTSWASPIVVEHAGRVQVIVPGTSRIRSYDLKDGTVIWESGGMSQNIVATPVHADGIVIVGSSYEKRSMYAIKLDAAAGDITGTENVLWSTRRSTPYVPSPLLYDGHLYFLAHYQNVLSQMPLEAGTPHNRFRLGPLYNIYASPVAADGRIYVSDLAGATMVMKPGPEGLEQLAVNQLDEVFSASAALVDGEIYLRGAQYLYCISEDG
ncbi:MAG: outer membrane protein assembly factor BamB family protein [Planctomycetota bacterium]|jgi:outer membrane protein assembly factor BamB